MICNARIIFKKSDVEVVALVEQHEQLLSWPPHIACNIGDMFRIKLGAVVVVHEKLASGQVGARETSDVMRWRTPDKNGTTRMDVLKKRHIIKREVRRYLDSEGFCEIDVPLLTPATTPDAEITSFKVDDRYLIPSSEYQIKRLEVGGFDKCYSLTQNFRKGDIGRYRNPEFTMLEWARVGQSLQQIEQDLENMFKAAALALGLGDSILYQGHKIDIAAPWQRITFKQAAYNATGAELSEFTAAAFLKCAEAAGLNVPEDYKDDYIYLYTIVIDHVQAGLGFDKPVFLTQWPPALTSSASMDKDYVERSEAFIAGVEISDGFPTLTDLKAQRSGFEMQQNRRKQEGGGEVVLDNKFLAAMAEGMPKGAGMALGFDRMVMLLTDQPQIKNVLAFDWDEV